MAVKAYGVSNVGGARVYDWEAGDNGDDGTPFNPGSSVPLAGAVQVIGGTVGTVTMQVSNDGTNWTTLKDLQGEDIALTDNALAEFSTAALYIRPLFGVSAAGALVRMVLRG